MVIYLDPRILFIRMYVSMLLRYTYTYIGNNVNNNGFEVRYYNIIDIFKFKLEVSMFL